MAAGESPKVAISSPAQYCGLRGARIRELPEEHKVGDEEAVSGADYPGRLRR